MRKNEWNMKKYSAHLEHFYTEMKEEFTCYLVRQCKCTYEKPGIFTEAQVKRMYDVAKSYYTFTDIERDRMEYIYLCAKNSDLIELTPSDISLITRVSSSLISMYRIFHSEIKVANKAARKRHNIAIDQLTGALDKKKSGNDQPIILDFGYEVATKLSGTITKYIWHFRAFNIVTFVRKSRTIRGLI